MTHLTLLIMFLLASACSSTTMRSGPGTALNVASLASGGSGNIFPADFKHQISVKGVLIRDVRCFIQFDDVNLEVVRADSPEKIIHIGKANENGKFDFHFTGPAISYVLALRNARGGRILHSKKIDATHVDRFQVSLDVCINGASLPSAYGQMRAARSSS